MTTPQPAVLVAAEVDFGPVVGIVPRCSSETDLHRNPAVLVTVGGHWKGLDDLEIATFARVS